MNVYQKLNLAREKFHQSEIKKTGHNSYAGYYYFELGDFVVPALKIFKEVGLTSVIWYETELATMAIINTDKPDEKILITTPMSQASLKGCHPVQNLGAVQTYIRRYLWTAALEIVEHDALDATTGKSEPASETKEEKPKTSEGAVISNEPPQVAVEPADQKLFVDNMIEMGDSCESQKELTRLWKVNQKTIDELKSNNPEQYKRLFDVFGTLKKNFQPKEEQ
jgi:hypothetical protein